MGQTPSTSAASPEDQPPGDETETPPPTPVTRPASVLTLDAAIDILMKKNLDTIASGLKILGADAEVLTACFRANPLGYDDGRLVTVGPLTGLRSSGATRYDVNISYPLDVRFKRHTHLRSSRSAKTIAEAQLQDAIRNRIDSLYTAFSDAPKRLRRKYVGSVRGSPDGGNSSKPAGSDRRTGVTGLLSSAPGERSSTRRRNWLGQDGKLGMMLDLPAADADCLDLGMFPEP